jgi:hypothetical protein
MKTTVLASAALCLCPPLVATSATLAVPSAKRAVHKLIAPVHHHRAKQVAQRPIQPCLQAPTRVVAADVPSAEDHTDLAELTDLGQSAAAPAERRNNANPVAWVKPPAPGFPVDLEPLVTRPTSPVIPVTPVTPVNPINPGAVPEPANWVMMVAGFLGIGMIVRRRKVAAWPRPRFKPAGIVAAAEVMGLGKLIFANSAAVAGSQTGIAATQALGTTLLKKAMVCVCSGAVLATAVTTVPPLRRAVYSATMPAPHATPRPLDCIATEPA